MFSVKNKLLSVFWFQKVVSSSINVEKYEK
jgi:hypothetical protein